MYNDFLIPVYGNQMAVIQNISCPWLVGLFMMPSAAGHERRRDHLSRAHYFTARRAQLSGSACAKPPHTAERFLRYPSDALLIGFPPFVRRHGFRNHPSAHFAAISDKSG